MGSLSTYNSYEVRKERAISFLVLISFMIQYFTDILRSNVAYVMALLFCGLLFAVSLKQTLRLRIGKTWIWVLPLLMIGISISRNPFDINVFADFVTYVICFVMCAMSGSHYRNFNRSYRVIKVMSFYYAVTVWIQMLLPSVYSYYLHLMPENIQSQITSQYRRLAFTGFSSNLAFTAGHILLGILVLLLFEKRRGRFWSFTLIFFVVTLMMTGKRSTFLFLIIALMAGYLANTAGRQRINRIFYITLAVVLALLLIVVFKEQLRNVPVLNRIIETVEGLQQGEDISSTRSVIYLYALGLFRENPIWGIGWGQFRDTTLGHITWVNTVEVHNIYLQLLCEVGIVGFAIMIIPMIASLVMSYKILREASFDNNWKELTAFSFIYQVFFVLYGLVENPLYDNNFLIIYFFTIAIDFAYLRYKRNSIVKAMA